MAYQATVNFSVVQNGQIVAQSAQAVSGEGENNRELALAGSAANLLVEMNIDISQLALVVFVCTVDATVKTNSSGSPDDTLDLEAGVPLFWVAGAGQALFLTEDVTALYVTNDDAADTAGVLTIRTLFDPTP